VASEDHVEAILVWSDRGPSDTVARWLTERGFAVKPMRAGLLVSGDSARFEAVFSTPLAGAERPLSLPIPATLRSNVQSIGIPELRRPHGA
jgi:hypothetical protein